jgi:hypothetical protein
MLRVYILLCSTTFGVHQYTSSAMYNHSTYEHTLCLVHMTYMIVDPHNESTRCFT